ncbi:MAG: hypothetical protein IT221_11065 [Fluviicola sp.]|nr:hypothetical protein [Fluviicola sp.]
MKALYLKIDKYLLEHFPLLWHSKTPYVLIGGIVLNILFFVIGFLTVDLSFLAKDELWDHYIDSYLVLLHLVLVVIANSFWALGFYKKNAIRHYYPVSPLYFTKLFALLFVGFMSLLTPFFTYNLGLQAKTSTYINDTELSKEIDIINQANLFLPSSENPYLFTKRVHPSIFPLDHISYDANLSNWENVPEFANQPTYSPYDHPENNDTIDGLICQFYTSYYRSNNKECDEYDEDEYLKKFYFPSKQFQLERLSFYNYSNIAISQSYFDANQDDDSYSSYYYYIDTDEYGEDGNTEYRQYAPKMHRWIKQQEMDSIKHLIQDYQKVLGKYELESFIDLDNYLNYLKQVSFHPKRYNLVHKSAGKFHQENLKFTYQQSAKDMAILADSTYNQPLFYVDQSRLMNIYGNFKYAKQHGVTKDELIGVILIALLMVTFFLFFEFVPFIQMLLSIPITGGFVIINALVFAFLYETTPYYSGKSETILGFQFLLVTGGLFLWLLYGLKSHLNKKFTAILMCMVYYVIPFIIPVFIQLMDQLTRYEIIGPCYSGTITEFTFWHDLMIPQVIIGGGVVLYLLYYRLVKLYYAKAE